MWTFLRMDSERTVTMAEETTNVNVSAQDSTGTTQNETTNTNSEVKNDANQTNQNEPQVDIEKLIQRAVDRATNKLGNEKKKLQEQLDTLKKEKLSDDEIKKLELADKEADIADREAKLTEKENRWIAIKAIKEAGLDDGGNNALELVDFVMSSDEETTKAKVKIFSDLVKKFVTAQVNETFKANGRNPEKSGSAETTTTNNYAAKIGKITAERNEAANNVLKQYLGGK